MTATPSELSARRIGALAPDPRRPGSVRLMVEGRTLLTIPREIAAQEGLEAGTQLEESLYTRLCRAADEEAAYRTVLRQLERRPFARRDLLRRLVLKGHPPEAAAVAVSRAETAGLVDDVRFTSHFVETRAARGRGPLRLRRDLAALGVDRVVVDQALAGVFEDGSSSGRVEALARKRLGQLKGLPRPVLRRRLLAYLSRRGYAGRAVTDLVQHLVASRS